MKILVLGGAGAMGREIVRELLQSDRRCRVTVADARCDFYQDEPPSWVKRAGRRLTWKAANLVREPANLVRMLRGHLTMINATTHHLNLPAMKVALQARVNYMDLGGLFHYTRRQLKFHKAFERKRLLAILGMGCAPGMSNLMAVHAAEGLDRVDEIQIKVGSCDLKEYRVPPGFVVVPYAVRTIREELMLKPYVFTQGGFKPVRSMSGKEKFRFPAPVGRQPIFYTLHSEVATLPLSFRKKGIREASFKIGFDQPLIDALLKPDRGTKFVLPLRSEDLEMTCALVIGRRRGRKVRRLAYVVVRSKEGLSAGTRDTAIPPAIVALLLPRIRKTGVLPPEQAVPVGAFIRQAKKRGFRVVRRASGAG